MGIFSKRRELDSTIIILRVLAQNIISLDSKSRTELGPILLGAVSRFLNSSDLSGKDLQPTYDMYQLLSGTAGLTSEQAVDSDPGTLEIQELIAESLPFYLPIVVLMPLRNMMTDFFLRNIRDVEEREVARLESFNGSILDIAVNALVQTINDLNSIHLDKSLKVGKFEFAAMSDLIALVLTNLDLHFKNI